ncbi:DNA excision repair protein ERCC-5 homolog [Zophobas morio]|uniref:DNA excision repair protein ERCC-5 homolog n=1 Tax=Zophobas morio TaxID=2755281 RepID=UPI003082CDDE
MGVQGLWRLIEPSGKPVPLETLQNKVLAIDVSIWLHQLVKGFQDSKGAALPNAHLLGIYHRVCKLLYFRIKPVFVFDGGVPVLKKNTIALRNQQKQKTLSEADRIHKNLLAALIKHTAISKVLSEQAKAAIASSTSPTKKSKTDDDNLYVLPELDSTVSSSDDSDTERHTSRHFDLHSIDTQSAEFKALPLEMRHEILSDLKETRKQSSWGRIHELPTESNDFSGYQMRRLLKRQSVQTALEEIEKEMGGHSLSLGELEKLLKDQGVITSMKGNRIASDENTRFLLIKDIKQALEEAKKQSLETIEEEEEGKGGEKVENKGDKEFEDDLQRAIELSLEEVPSTSKDVKVKKVGEKGKNRMSLSFLADFEDADFGDSESSEEEEVRMRLTPAQRYMMEYSGLTAHAIAKIIESNSRIGRKNGEEKTSVEAAESSKGRSTPVVESTTTLDEESEEDKNEASTAVVEDFEDQDENQVTTSTATEEPVESTTEKVAEVELMSESEDDDFVDVDNKENANTMEVVIKPDEEIEDDLFKDVFEEEQSEANVSSTQDKVIEQIISLDDDEEEKKEDREALPEKEEQTKSTSQTMMDKIEKMIETYSKPREQKEAKEKEPEKEESPKVSVEQLREMKENLTKEQNELIAQRSTKERLAGNITDQMCQEAQELLELFGVPYLVAPMEAEAQCAFLDLIELTDGTITDDSDIWLFGGRTVYKNFFDQNKVVMEFKVDSIQRHYKLSREQMILLAMLVGSDYTTGLTGVGPVTALEILAAFPPKNHLVSGLAEFKSWVKKGKLPGPGRTSLRGKLKNVSVSDNFPNPQIVQAYLEPTVETSREKFSWGKPDIPGLVDFAKQKFGWTKIKSEEILAPILRRLEDNRVQKSITEYFKYEVKASESGVAEKLMSKRVKTAINRIAKGPDFEEEKEEKKRVTRKKKGESSEEPKTKRKKQVKKKEPEDEDIKILKETEERSQKRVEEIQKEVCKEVEGQKEKKINLQRLLHKKEVIPQRQKDKSDILKNKMKAIEAFRKSKQGPGYVKKRGKVRKDPQKDASYLSEGSSSD